jgi:hypothetical protein
MEGRGGLELTVRVAGLYATDYPPWIPPFTWLDAQGFHQAQERAVKETRPSRPTVAPHGVYQQPTAGVSITMYRHEANKEMASARPARVDAQTRT